MATTTNYSWSTPDDTALVKDGAAAIRSLGTAIDSTVFTNAGAAIAKTIVDAKGDLIAATAADTVARLAVGTDNQRIVAASGEAAGLKYVSDTQNTVIDAEGDLLVGDSSDTLQKLSIGTTGQVLTCDTTIDGKIKWAAAAATGANWSLLNTGGTALTGAGTITVSGISGVDKIMILFDASATNAGSEFSVRFNGDSGNNYYRYGTYQQWGSTYINGNYTYNQGVDNRFFLCTMGNSAGNAGSGYCFVSGCNSSGLKVFEGVGAANGTNSVHSQQGGYYNSSSVISSISIVSSNSNFDAGTVYVYTSA
jgi:hypothetical protein